MVQLGDGMERKMRYDPIKKDVLCKTLQLQRKGWGNGEEKRAGSVYRPAIHLD